MKAAVISAPGQVDVTTVPDPTPGPRQVVVAVAGCGIGDQVAVDPSLQCHECYYCRRGRGNLCERWAAIGVTTAGGAAEYAVAPVANCVRLPEGRRSPTTPWSSRCPAPCTASTFLRPGLATSISSTALARWA